ncbi:hypothetical protein Nepgr_009144 [Nepenthes gracilis]|uniref:Uncharacterized protein n=1 Tax=Nepenthes gracilis TaxID=150966 RepID=A0AAD3XJY9_NEPGR|nr:hypothetical protein Nepgr_009144 [Nepenthes gracilis]
MKLEPPVNALPTACHAPDAKCLLLVISRFFLPCLSINDEAVAVPKTFAAPTKALAVITEFGKIPIHLLSNINSKALLGWPNYVYPMTIAVYEKRSASERQANTEQVSMVFSPLTYMSKRVPILITNP